MVDPRLEIGHRWTSIENENYTLLFYIPPYVTYNHYLSYDYWELEW